MRGKPTLFLATITAVVIVVSHHTALQRRARGATFKMRTKTSETRFRAHVFLSPATEDVGALSLK